MSESDWFVLGWSALVFLAGAAVGGGLVLRWRFRIWTKTLRQITPFELAQWQHRDAQRRVDAIDRRPR